MPSNLDDLREAVVGAAIEVHRNWGAGLLERAYELALCEELSLRGIQFQSQAPLPLSYKGKDLGLNYVMDMVVENCLVVELKAVEQLLPIHKAQVITYLKVSGHREGLLLNFNVPFMKIGIKRLFHPNSNHGEDLQR